MASRAEIKGKISMDGSGVEVGLAKARQGADAFKSRIKGVGVAIAGAFAVEKIANFTAQMIQQASAMTDAASLAGTTTEEYQAMIAAGIEVGASSEVMSAALLKMRGAQARAIEGDDLIVKSLESLGISMDRVAELSPGRLFEEIGAKMAESGQSAESLNAIIKIFGEDSGPRLVDAFQKIGEDGLDPLIAGYKEHGVILDRDVAAKLDKANDIIEITKKKWGNFWKTQIANIITATEKFVNYWKAAFGADIPETTGPPEPPVEEEETKAERDRRIREAGLEARRKRDAEEKGKKDAEKTAKASGSANRIAADSLRAIGAGGVGMGRGENLLQQQLDAANRRNALLEAISSGTMELVSNTRDGGLI